MKFLCVGCDQAMKLSATEGPDRGSLSVTFRCPECGVRVAMLTNPGETQLVRSLGVHVGGGAEAGPPFEHLRAMLSGGRPGAFAGGSEPTTAGAVEGSPQSAVSAPTWDAGAEARLARVPPFIRPMARRAIERFAESHGHAVITEAVMDEARGTLGM